MGLTKAATGHGAVDEGLAIEKDSPNDHVIALAGNPNVGKSTVFNELTGMNQHTGNWPGKTVTNAQGKCEYNGETYILVDLPGTYSLMAHSAEEEVARDFICFGEPDAVIVVCDATCLERNLNLVIQTIEITPNVIVCVNLIDEAQRKQIEINLEKLEKQLGVPVVGTSARSGIGLDALLERTEEIVHNKNKNKIASICYPDAVEEAVSMLCPVLEEKIEKDINVRWTALKLLDEDETLVKSLSSYIGFDIFSDEDIAEGTDSAQLFLQSQQIDVDTLRDRVVSSIVLCAETIAKKCVLYKKQDYDKRDRKIDKILTNKWTGIPIMLLLLAVIFWLTITGANYPSDLLSRLLFWVQDRLTDFFHFIHAPEWLHGMLVLGVYRVLAWVVSVMLPPMMIFFPLFTLLEDLGYLPRVAFNLDKYFKKACACGKQALTMCMGFGCNAAGIVGCRIIDSPRERLIAMITNNFVPCNGRFPTLIAIISMFFIGSIAGLFQSVVSTLLLVGVIVLGILMTFLVSRLLSKTILKGVPSSFTLELPPYRKPQIGKVIVRSIFDRTLFVLGRAISVAAPAGLVIWLLANIDVGDVSLLSHCAAFFDPFGRLIGLDGVIIMAFILGFPANEIVIPIMLMAYMATGSITDFQSLSQLKEILISNGWTWVTAVCTMLFSLMHWPCSTTCLTIRKESGSWKWTVVSFLVPTVCGIILCFLFANAMRLCGLV